jgi:hypothetical protein
METPLRFIERDGRKILQYRRTIRIFDFFDLGEKSEWVDVPFVTSEKVKGTE